MTSIRRRGASLVVLALAGIGWGCGGVVLPDDARPAGIKIVSGDGQSAPAGQALAQPLVVQVIDALNRPVEGQTVTFAIDAGGGTVAPGSAETGTDGEASATWTLGNGAGQQTLHAQVTGDGAPAAADHARTPRCVRGTCSIAQRPGIRFRRRTATTCDDVPGAS